ncbi:hypothetical protein SDC9_65043 [bioreactor metagenome]|uniref:Uncharacterized protein n=1 Tax=bioreactor metagenome TaxID=1076179 RepID=A0A644XQW4_9ZZZZ
MRKQVGKPELVSPAHADFVVRHASRSVGRCAHRDSGRVGIRKSQRKRAVVRRGRDCCQCHRVAARAGDRCRKHGRKFILRIERFGNLSGDLCHSVFCFNFHFHRVPGIAGGREGQRDGSRRGGRMCNLFGFSLRGRRVILNREPDFSHTFVSLCAFNRRNSVCGELFTDGLTEVIQAFDFDNPVDTGYVSRNGHASGHCGICDSGRDILSRRSEVCSGMNAVCIGRQSICRADLKMREKCHVAGDTGDG